MSKDIRLIRVSMYMVSFLFLSACSGKYNFIETPNQNERVKEIVIHHTVIDKEQTLEVFMDKNAELSAHYVITTDSIYQLAKLEKRTYHAGVSFWRNRTNLNDTSIGIELVQEISCSKGESNTPYIQAEVCVYPDFSPELTLNLVKVLSLIYEEYPDIEPVNIISHQDIAPLRKKDPGPRFPWQYLATEGFGAWYDESDYFNEYKTTFEAAGFDYDLFMKALTTYGYREVKEENDSRVITAFQTHFTPSLVTGSMTRESYAAIFSLLKKYDVDSYYFLKERKGM